MIRFDVLGTPAPKGSNRAVLNKHTHRAMMIPGGSNTNEHKIYAWNIAVREAAREACGRSLNTPYFIHAPLIVTILFRMQRPSGHWGKKGLKPSAPQYPTVKPDIDKLARTTLDALTGIVFDDDSRIVSLVCTKVFAKPGEEGMGIEIRAADMPQAATYQGVQNVLGI